MSYSPVNSLVVIDRAVTDYERLIKATLANTEILLLDSRQDGIEQITVALRDRPSLQTLHIVAHGAPGCIELGNTQLSLSTLDRYSQEIQSWFALSQVAPPTLLLYGCNVAAGDAGSEFLSRLHILTGATVYASTTLIGNADKGGNWELDAHISSQVLAGQAAEPTLAFQAEAMAAYAGVLVNPPSSLDLVTGVDSGLSNTDNITNSKFPVLIGDADAGSTVELFYSLGGAPTVSLGTTTADGNGKWFFIVNSPLPQDGSYQITATATLGGTTSSSSTPLELTLDTTATYPSAIDITDASDTGISKTDTYTKITTPTVTGKAEAFSFIEVYDGHITNTGSPIATTTADALGNWSVTVSALSEDGHNLIVRATDRAGNVAATSGYTLVVDTIAPTLGSVSSNAIDRTYGAGATIPIDLWFNENVYVDTTNGAPKLTLTTGSGKTTVLNYSSVFQNRITFNYTVQPGDSSADLDYASTGAFSLNGAVITDRAGNDAVINLAAPGASGSLGANKAIVIDTTPPTVTGVTSGAANGFYNAGDVIPIQVNFSEAVYIAGSPQLTITTGSGQTRTLNYSSGHASSVLTFNYTVAAGDNVADLDYASVTALTGIIRDVINNDAVLTLPTPGQTNSLGSNKNITIDTTKPTVQSVTSSVADGFYNTGDVIPVQVVFNEAVVVTGTPQLSIVTGSNQSITILDYASGSGTNTLTFNYTVQTADGIADLDYLSVNAFILNSGTIKDLADNDAILTLAAPGAAGSLGANKNITIDNTAPTVSNVSSTATNNIYKAGDIIPITVTFAENVFVTGTPSLQLNSGATVNYTSGSSTNTLTFNYTVGSGNTSADLDYTSVNALVLNGGTIRDAAGNNATLTLATPGATNSLGANKAIAVDTTLPTVKQVSSSKANGAYGAGTVIPIQVQFTESITVTGTPQLTLKTADSKTTTLNYTSGSGSDTITFTYTVQPGDEIPDLDYSSAGALTLNGGSIRDAAGNNAILTLATPGAANSLGANAAIAVDTLAPTVSSVTPPAAKTYVIGEYIDIAVKFSEVVELDLVGNKPSIALTLDNGKTVNAVYESGSGTDTHTFRYQVVAGDNDVNGIQIGNTINLNGSVLEDLLGNDANLTLNNIASSAGVKVEGISPSVSQVTAPADQTYKVGDVLSFSVKFSEIVLVTDTPKLAITLDNGSKAYAVYESGSNSDTLIFKYTVVEGDSGKNGLTVSAIDLTNGTIEDLIGNTTDLTVTSPTNQILIDGVSPFVEKVSAVQPSGLYKAGDKIDITLKFNEVVTVDSTNGTPQLQLATGTPGTLVDYKSGSGTDTLTFTYTIQAGENSLSLGYAPNAALILNNSTIKDNSGNNATLLLPAAGTPDALSSKGLVIDTTSPTVVGVTSPDAGDSYKVGDTIHVAVHFNEAIALNSTNGSPQLKLAIGSKDVTAAFAEVSSDKKSLVFTYTVQAGDDVNLLDYRAITSLVANGAILTDLVGNTAKLDLPTPGSSGSLGSQTISIDTIAPLAPQGLILDSLSDSGRLSNDKITTVTTPTIKGKAEPNSVIKLYEGSTLLGTASTNGNGDWAVTSSQLGNGVHNLKVTSTDVAGNVSPFSDALSFTIDLAAPVAPTELVLASDAGTSPSDRLTNTTTPVIKGKAEQNSTVKLYKGETLLGTTIADAQGNWSITSSVLPEGSHALTAIVTDVGGNTGPASTPLTITIDTTQPGSASDLVLPKLTGEDSKATNIATPSIQGKADKNSTVTLYKDNVAVGTAATDSNGNWIITTTKLPEGVNSLTAVVTDAAGNVGVRSQPVVITVDTLAPIAPGLPDLSEGSDTGTTNNDNNTTDTTPTLVGRAEVNSRIDLFVGGVLTASVRANENGFWTHTLAPLPQGTHSITTRATDAAGNTSGVSPALVIAIDTALPGAPSTPTLAPTSDTGTSNTDKLTRETMPTLMGTAEPNSRVNLYQGDTFVGAAFTNLAGKWRYTLDTPLADGTYRFRAVAIDQAGQLGESSGWMSMTVDATASGAPTDITVNRNSSQWNSPTISGLAEANSIVKLYDGDKLLGTATANGEGKWSIATNSLAEGDHLFSAVAIDVAGNQSQSSVILKASVRPSDSVFDASTGAFVITPTLLNLDENMSGFNPGNLFNTRFRTTPRPDKVAGTASNDWVRGFGANDYIDTKAGHDVLLGGAGNDTLMGGAGNDMVIGGRGNDTLTGGSGDDILVGHLQADVLNGGAGKDKFVFRREADGGDRIVGFNRLQDSIVVNSATFLAGLQPGTLPADQFRLGAKALDSNDRFIFNRGTLLFDLDGSGRAKPIMLAQMGANVRLTSENITIS